LWLQGLKERTAMGGAAANAPEFACGGRKFPPRPMPASTAAQGRGTMVCGVPLARLFMIS